MHKRGASESSSAAMYTRNREFTLLKEHLGLLHTRCLRTAAQSD